MRKAVAPGLLILSALLAVSSTSRAQTNEEGFDKKAEDAIAADKQLKDERQGTKMPGERGQGRAARSRHRKFDPKEEENKAYRLSGPLPRHHRPEFMINISRTAARGDVFSFRSRLAIRKDRSSTTSRLVRGLFDEPVHVQGAQRRAGGVQLVSAR
jgi:hypothetical protein